MNQTIVPLPTSSFWKIVGQSELLDLGTTIGGREINVHIAGLYRLIELVINYKTRRNLGASTYLYCQNKMYNENKNKGYTKCPPSLVASTNRSSDTTLHCEIQKSSTCDYGSQTHHYIPKRLFKLIYWTVKFWILTSCSLPPPKKKLSLSHILLVVVAMSKNTFASCGKSVISVE